MIVLDANILIRAILGRRVRQLIETYAAQGFRFVAPEVAFDDAQKYLPPLLRKRGKPDADVPKSLEYLKQMVEPIDRELYGENLRVKPENVCADAMRMTGRYWQLHWGSIATLGARIKISSGLASPCGRQTGLKSF